MFVAICADCVIAGAGYDEKELGRPYSTEFPPMSLIPMQQRYVVTETDCDGKNVDEGWCEGHFSHLPCDGCGEPRAGARFCHSAVQTK